MYDFHEGFAHDMIHEIKIGKRTVKLKRGGQKDYGNAILDNVLTVASGPPGTGKTYIAVAVALNMFQRELIQKIIMVRPAVTAGEDLGYLPGDLQQKVDPFLRPLTDALHFFLGVNETKQLVGEEKIEMASVAYMRGRTFSDCFVICDEAQNMTPAQMKLLTTRIGYGTKMVVTGDTTQIDLENQQSGLLDLADRITGDPDAKFIELTSEENHRHPLVDRLARSYNLDEKPINPLLR